MFSKVEQTATYIECIVHNNGNEMLLPLFVFVYTYIHACSCVRVVLLVSTIFRWFYTGQFHESSGAIVVDLYILRTGFRNCI